MNRANLPKVFGELLFLLEYRDRPARLAYRSAGDTFALPENLWIIGTMNLADRSVGQIDAALRRRFAFVPFSPSDENNGGLLRRWLTKQNHPTWPADLVDEVNTELEADLGHSDLLIGPSYFMKQQVDEEQMSRIWRYSIEPLASDLFHGDELLVSKYQWDSVIQRHGSLLPQSRVADVRD
jgi:5-methylcytosine-specific restriction protein B